LFFFQAEDCIRYFHVTGVQTCALPIFRLMASGPRCGLYEIQLPEMQPGSSIMPGKVNPVMAEVLNQTCFLVMGLDLTVTLAAEAGQLELNVMEPVMGHALFTSIDSLANVIRLFTERCITGIKANRERCEEMVSNSVGLDPGD